MRRFKPLPVDSVGFITNYRCTFQCDHCLYCASPHVHETIDEADLDSLIAQLDRVLGPIPLHIGGGEPLLNFDLVCRLLSRLKETTVRLEYVETNGSSLVTERRQKLHALKHEGLDCLLVSISPFHNAFIPLAVLKEILGDVLDVFGHQGLFPWHTGYLPFLERVSPERKMPVLDYFAHFSQEEIRYQLTRVMYIHPGGRAAYFLAAHLPCRPVEALLQHERAGALASPVHAHVDFKGNYLTGFCSGLRLGNGEGFSLARLYRDGVLLNRFPILALLVSEGVKGLYEHARSAGYSPRREGYVSPCHLCLDMRVFLYFNEAQYEEFYPDFFYEALRPRG